MCCSPPSSHLPPHSADGLDEIHNAGGLLVAMVDPFDELVDPDSAALLASRVHLSVEETE